MSNEFCPKCRALRNIVVSVSRRKQVGSDGNPGEILTRDYYCETCRSLLRSEEIEDARVVEDIRDEEGSRPHISPTGRVQVG
jgi:hypothetical protein